MKKILILFTVFSLAFTSCKKEDTINYEESIIGVWQIMESESRIYWEFTEDNKFLSGSDLYLRNPDMEADYSVRGRELTTVYYFANSEDKWTSTADIEFINDDHIRIHRKNTLVEREGKEPITSYDAGSPPTMLKRIYSPN